MELYSIVYLVFLEVLVVSTFDNRDFLKNIAEHTQTHNIIYHVPKTLIDKNILLKNVQFPTSVVFYNEYNISNAKPWDLHVFIQNDNFTQDSMKELNQIFHKRQKSNKEVWIMDINDLNSAENAKKTLQDLQLGRISIKIQFYVAIICQLDELTCELFIPFFVFHFG